MKIAKIIGAGVLAAAGVYGAIAFVAWDFDPRSWSMFGRFIAVYSAGFLSFGAIALTAQNQ